MKHSLLYGAALLTVAPWLTSCIDDGYDLSDIDTNTEIKVDNLVVPVNIDNILLDNIISLDEGSKIKNVNGSYVFLDEGTFSSSEIEIKEVQASSPEIESSHAKLHFSEAMKTRAAGELKYTFALTPSPFSYKVENVDEAVHSIDAAEVSPLEFRIALSIPELQGKISKSRFENVRIQLPRGLKLDPGKGTYNPADGVLMLPTVDGTGHAAEVKVYATAIDFKANGAGVDYATHTFNFNSALNILSGDAYFDPADITGNIPDEISITVDYTLGELNLLTVDGSLEYHIEGIDIDPIDMTDIPDFLGQDETNIFLARPELYLGVNNPVAGYNVYFQSGFSLSPVHPGGVMQTYSLDNGPLRVGYEKGNTQYSFCILPPANTPTQYPGYDNAEKVAFSKLTDVLSGNGIPTQIGVNLDDPMLPLQTVKKFRIGENIGAVEGKWTIYAPLALTPQSRIIYTDTLDGWWSEDLDAVTITKLEVSALADTDLPIGATLTGYPVDRDGNRIGTVEVTPVQLPANAKDFQLTVNTVNGDIRHLDGFCFRAVVAPGSEDALKPEQTIKLRNIRARVSGTYIKKL